MNYARTLKWMVTHFLCFQYWHKLLKSNNNIFRKHLYFSCWGIWRGGQSCWFGLFFWRDFFANCISRKQHSAELSTWVPTCIQTQYGQCWSACFEMGGGQWQCWDITKVYGIQSFLRTTQKQPAPHFRTTCNTRTNDFNNPSLHVTFIHHQCRWPCIQAGQNSSRRKEN